MKRAMKAQKKGMSNSRLLEPTLSKYTFTK